MRVLIATHGKMASGVKNMLGLFLDNSGIETIDAYVDEHDYTEDIIRFIQGVGDEKAFIFTDMIGGSVNQKVVALNNKENVKIISGFNISLLMEILLSKPENDDEIENAIAQARDQMQLIKLASVEEETEDSFLD